MRAFLTLLFTLGLIAPVFADDAGAATTPPAAAKAPAKVKAKVTGKIIKVLPLWVDQQQRIAVSPSLFDRDAYQAHLRENPAAVSGIRYDVHWSAAKSAKDKLTLRVELRGVGQAGVPRLKSLETEVTRGTFSRWTTLTLGGDDFKQFGSVVAWRATLWNGAELLGSQQSFLW